MDPQNNPTPPTNANPSPDPALQPTPPVTAQPTPPQPSWDVAPQSPASPNGMPASAGAVPPAYGQGQAVVTSLRPKKKRLLIASVIAGIVVLLGGGSAAAYYGYILPNKPQNVLGAALANEFTPGKINTEHAHGSFSFKGQDNMDMSGTFKAAIDKSGPFDVSGNFDAIVTKVTFGMRSTDAKDFYVRVGGLDGLSDLLGVASGSETDEYSMAALYAPIISAVNNKWFVINQSLLKQVDPQVSNGFKLSDGDRQKIVDAYKKHQFLVVQQKLKDEKVGSQNSTHLKVVVGKQEAKDFAAEVKAANISSIKITSDQLKDFNKSVDQTDFSKYPVDVWVSKGQKFIDQVSFNIKQDQDEFHTTYTIDDWNAAVKVTKPADAKSLLELLGQVYGGSGTDDVQTLLDSNGQGSGISL